MNRLGQLFRRPWLQIALLACVHFTVAAWAFGTGERLARLADGLLWPLAPIVERLLPNGFAGSFGFLPFMANGLLWAAAVVGAYHAARTGLRRSDRPGRALLRAAAIVLVPLLLAAAALAGLLGWRASVVATLPAWMLVFDAPWSPLHPPGWMMYFGIAVMGIFWIGLTWTVERAALGRKRWALVALAAVGVLFFALGFRTSKLDAVTLDRRWGVATHMTVDMDGDGISEREAWAAWGTTIFADGAILRERYDRDEDGRWDLWIEQEDGVLRADQDGDGEPDIEVEDTLENWQRYRLPP